jgi:hypothetical protein
LGLFLNAHQNSTLMPLVQEDKYSWHDGGIVSITESAKTTADNLKNPLINLNEEIQRLEELLKSKSVLVPPVFIVLVPFSLISSSPPLPVICAVLSAGILS